MGAGGSLGFLNKSPGFSYCSQPKGHFITQHTAAFERTPTAPGTPFHTTSKATERPRTQRSWPGEPQLSQMQDGHMLLRSHPPCKAMQRVPRPEGTLWQTRPLASDGMWGVMWSRCVTCVTHHSSGVGARVWGQMSGIHREVASWYAPYLTGLLRQEGRGH